MEATREEEEAAPPAMLLVEELASHVPERFVNQTEDRPTMVAPVAQIPTIDLGLLSRQHAGGGEEEAAKLQSTLQSWGIFLVTGHGMEPSLIDAMRSAATGFGRQPVEEKKKYTELADGEHYEDYHQGYGTKQLKLQDQTALDWLDRLQLRVEPQDKRKLRLWPESFRDILHEYCAQQQCRLLNNALLPAMARFLGLDEDYFVRHLGDGGYSLLRINYYPPCPRPDLVFGFNAHSDASLISVIMVGDNVKGLQVLKDDVWYDVPASTHPDAMLVLVGDVGEIMSNGVFKSPVHRVVTNAHKQRMSMVMFYAPDLEKEIGPADELVDDSHPARYKKVNGVEYLSRVYEDAARGKKAIDTLRI